MTMTDLTELCHSHTDQKSLFTVITRIKKVHILMLEQTFCSKNQRYATLGA